VSRGYKQKLKARDKVTHKMSRDGLIKRNAATGEDARVSKREIELDLRGGKPERGTFFFLIKGRAAGSQKNINSAAPLNMLKTLIKPRPRILRQYKPVLYPKR
jgi:hypothetical protein